MEQNRNRSLAHYGVLGMKWGVRKKGLNSSVNRSSTKSPSQKEVDDVRSKFKNKSIKQIYNSTEIKNKC